MYASEDLLQQKCPKWINLSECGRHFWKAPYGIRFSLTFVHTFYISTGRLLTF